MLEEGIWSNSAENSGKTGVTECLPSLSAADEVGEDRGWKSRRVAFSELKAGFGSGWLGALAAAAGVFPPTGLATPATVNVKQNLCGETESQLSLATFPCCWDAVG